MALTRLIAEATALGGGNVCALGHDWKFTGGRACPYDCDQSQSVYECKRCGAVDYGEPGGPAHAECHATPGICCDGHTAPNQTHAR